MAEEEFLSRALRWDDPNRIKTIQDLYACVDWVGFLPLFANGVPGSSVEESTAVWDWWSEDPERDPWLWREQAAREGRVAYGKFFDGRAGFLSLSWLPVFANARRDGYDFDALWDDGKARWRAKRIMDCFQEGEEHLSFELRNMAGFGKGGEPGFEGTVTGLQHDLYLVIRDFRQRRNRRGEPYGWPITVYATPESIWGRETVTSAYSESPAESRRRILERARELYPTAEENELKKIFL